MSSTKKSSSGAKKASDVILEPDGKINTSKLEESMHKALEFDVKYRQTDNAKKRAIKVSGSYEDFKVWNQLKIDYFNITLWLNLILTMHCNDFIKSCHIILFSFFNRLELRALISRNFRVKISTP